MSTTKVHHHVFAFKKRLWHEHYRSFRQLDCQRIERRQLEQFVKIDLAIKLTTMVLMRLSHTFSKTQKIPIELEGGRSVCVWERVRKRKMELVLPSLYLWPKSFLKIWKVLFKAWDMGNFWCQGEKDFRRWMALFNIFGIHSESKGD